MARWAACSTLLLLATCISGCKLNDPAAAAAGRPYTVTAVQLNCHDGAGLHTPVREQLLQNTAVNVVALQGAWAELHRTGWDCWVKTAFIAHANVPPAGVAPGEIAMVDDGGGTWAVPVQIGSDLTLKFTIDSGAAVVVVPADVVMVMARQGLVTSDDFSEDKTYVMANGSTSQSKDFVIKSLKVGDIVLQNVRATTAPPGSSLLLGQTALSQLGSWSVDNTRHVLMLNEAPNSAAATAAVAKVSSFYDASTGSGPDDAVNVRPFFADRVSFYGEQLGLDDLMAKQVQYATRWPVRSYTVRPQTLVPTCSSDGACTVTGLVDWSASSPADGRSATGVAQFSLTFRDDHIVAESGKVLSRQRSDATPGTPSAQSEPDSPPT